MYGRQYKRHRIEARWKRSKRPAWSPWAAFADPVERQKALDDLTKRYSHAFDFRAVDLPAVEQIETD